MAEKRGWLRALISKIMRVDGTEMINRRALHLRAGTNVTLTVADSAVRDETLVTISVLDTMTTELLETRTSLASDRGKRLRTTSGSPVNYTVTQGQHAAGDKIDIAQGGAGLLTIVEGTNVTVNVRAGKGLKMDGQEAHATLVCESTGGTDVFTLLGEITA